MQIPRIVILLTAILLFSISLVSAQWVITNGPLGGAVRSFAVSDTNLYAGTESGGISVTTDYGTNWITINTGLTNTNASALVISADGTYIFAGTGGSGVFRSLNKGNGASWIDRSTGLTNLSVHALIANATYMYAGTENGVFRSNTTATNWMAMNSGLPNNLNVNSLVFIGNKLFAGTDNGIYRSTNDGADWIAINSGLTNLSVYSLAVIGTYICAGTLGGGVFLSINNGDNWFDVNNGLTNPNIRTLAVKGSNLFAGTSSISPPPGVFLSTNNGTSWMEFSSGLNPNAHIWSLILQDSFIFAGTNGNGVWRRPSVIMTIQSRSEKTPSRFELDQNYPNPFNPTTTITFSLPTRSFVSLKIFDALGREVSNLVFEELSAGAYSQQWNAAGFPSGVYFYRLQAGDFVETKKLILLK
ncbi:MAG: T9SS type A sorting domain-containing protein [Ignavibacteriales bacterium]|nr:T9SS type A sorting domain-containing protein [Ignavibacteriales bacterium]